MHAGMLPKPLLSVESCVAENVATLGSGVWMSTNITMFNISM